MTELEQMLYVRPMEGKRDRGFVASTWIESYAQASRTLGVPKGYLYRHDDLVTLLLARNGAALVCLREDAEAQPIAWGCMGRGSVHYIYVPAKLFVDGATDIDRDRARMLEDMLLRHHFGDVPDRIYSSHKYLSGAPDRIVFDPYLTAVDG